MKIGITGGLGHIGSYLLRDHDFLDAVSEIIVVDNLETQRYASLFNLPPGSRYRFLQAQVSSEEAKSLLADCEVIVHLAAGTDQVASMKDSGELSQRNLRATQAVISLCLGEGIPLIFPSSTSVYSSPAPVVDEDCLELSPVSNYSQTKLKEESRILKAFSCGLTGTIFRFGTIFGASAGMRFHTAVNQFCWNASVGQPLRVWTTALDQIRPYLDVRDAAAVITKSVAESLYSQTVLNAVTCNVTVRDVLNEVGNHISPVRVEFVDSPAMNQLSYSVSTEKAEDIGFKFTGSLERGIQETIQKLQGLIPSHV